MLRKKEKKIVSWISSIKISSIYKLNILILTITYKKKNETERNMCVYKKTKQEIRAHTISMLKKKQQIEREREREREMLKDARSEISFLKKMESADWERNGMLKRGSVSGALVFVLKIRKWKWKGVEAYRESQYKACNGWGRYIYVCVVIFPYFYIKCLQYYLFTLSQMLMYILFVFTFNSWAF